MLRMICSTAVAITVMLLIATSTAQAKHRYFGNVLPGSNYLNRCLGIGWSDGYHAHGGWTTKHVQHPRAPYATPAYTYPIDNATTATPTPQLNTTFGNVRHAVPHAVPGAIEYGQPTPVLTPQGRPHVAPQAVR